MRRSRDNRGHTSHRSDNKTRQVCALAERILTLALAEHSDPLLQSLHVSDVVPSPTVARLLVVVQPLVQVEGERIADILSTLEANRGYFRRELAAELNRKKTPELSFTIGTAEPLERDDDFEVATPARHRPPDDPSHDDLPAPGLPRDRPPTPIRARVVPPQKHEPLAVSLHSVIESPGAVAIKTWTTGVPVEEEALTQLDRVARLPIVSPWVAVMPDVHVGIGATVGSVIPTRGAIIPAAVGVDIGCGMMAVRTTLTADSLPDSLYQLRCAIESAVPHGRGQHGDVGSWDEVPTPVGQRWRTLEPEFNSLAERHPAIRKANHAVHLGTLGTGNHFIELCLDESDRVWVMLHSGSRGVGNRLGTYFIELAKRDMERHIKQLPHADLAYFSEGSDHFYDYVRAVDWAQRFARTNRELMMSAVLGALRAFPDLPPFEVDERAVNCHHNYVELEVHFGQELYVTRKGAVSAKAGELGIIPGSMGARSFIVRGRGNPDSFCSCSHGAGRRMSRTQAKARFTVDDHERATRGVECRKDKDVLDETPAAYKDIDAVLAAQRDLVEVAHTLEQVVCVKG